MRGPCRASPVRGTIRAFGVKAKAAAIPVLGYFAITGERYAMFRHIIIPGTQTDLLRRELAAAFAAEGAKVSVVPPAELHDPAGARRLEALLEDGPAFLFSVNFQGLSPLRPALELLARAGGAAAVWLVDNPWNILSGVRDPRWKGLPLFVTDASFIAPLKAHGAAFAHHLPLAASLELFAPEARRDAAFPPPADLAPFVFVGRSAFPGKEIFFAGQSVAEEALAKARAMLERGERPDLPWWEEETRTAGAVFWPGKAARRAALGAEEANLFWRASCVREAGRAGADLFGDAGWRDLPGLAGGVRVFPPVDYYARLPGIYRAARHSLCLTSLQLPAGLNQRHFDVWAAGGVALSDATPGLALFPEELTRPVTFRRAADIVPVAERLAATHRRADLVRDWQGCLAAGHTYRHRVCAVLEAVAAGRGSGARQTAP